MKVNLKGLGNVKGLLLAHGEKLGIALVGVCAVMFVWSSLSHESLPEQYEASRLKSQIDQVSREVRDYSWDQASPEAVKLATPLKQSEDLTVRPELYAISAYGWDRPVIPPTVLRKDPELLAAVDVEVNSGSGLLAFQDPAIEEQLRLKEEQEKQEQAKEQEARRQREQEDTRTGRNRGGRDQTDRNAAPIDPKHPKRRPVSSGVPPAGVRLTGVERIDPAYWAVVVAKVPIREQLRRYRDVLTNARDYDPQYDVPQYLGYQVERAEVVPGQQKLNWEPVYVYDGQRSNIESGKRVWPYPVVTAKPLARVTKYWVAESGMREVVDDRFFDPDYILPFPLPPLVGRDWGENVTHSDIPLIANDEGLDAMQEEVTSDAAETPAAVDESSMWTADAARTGARGGGALGRRGGGRGAMDIRGGAMYGEGRGGRESYSGRSAGRGGRGGRSGGGGMLAKDVSYWLLRFFDFNVEPGKKYKYRVQLVLSDVNNVHPSNSGRMVDKDAVEKEVLSRQSKEKVQGIRYTEWSKPSPTVGIPLAGDVRVAGAKAANDSRYNDEPRLNLMITSFGIGEENRPIQAAKEEEDLRRGSVANMTEDVEVLVEGGNYIDEVKSFPFRTGITVVDIRGGEKLPNKLLTPAQALLMDPTGHLYVRQEEEDFDEVDHHRLLFAKPEKGSQGAPFGGRREMGFEMRDAR